MAQHFDPQPLNDFFQEVEEQLHLSLKYHSENVKFPIQLTNSPEGTAKNKCEELLVFIKSQVDLLDNKIAKIHPSKERGKFLIEITMEATIALSEVYALSFFHEHDEEPLVEPKPASTNGKAKKDHHSD